MVDYLKKIILSLSLVCVEDRVPSTVIYTSVPHSLCKVDIDWTAPLDFRLSSYKYRFYRCKKNLTGIAVYTKLAVTARKQYQITKRDITAVQKS